MVGLRFRVLAGEFDGDSEIRPLSFDFVLTFEVETKKTRRTERAVGPPGRARPREIFGPGPHDRPGPANGQVPKEPVHEDDGESQKKKIVRIGTFLNLAKMTQMVREL